VDWTFSTGAVSQPRNSVVSGRVGVEVADFLPHGDHIHRRRGEGGVLFSSFPQGSSLIPS
jgi:hypothetical protein